MLNNASAREIQRVRTRSLTGADSDVAVLLNGNARRVTGAVLRKFSQVMSSRDIYVTKALEQVPATVAKVVAQNYRYIFLGGGDGTFTQFVGAIVKECYRQGKANNLPKIGVLKLGTGNAMASHVGASGLANDALLDDVLAARSGALFSYKKFELLDVNGELAPFAGVGIDGKLLNDYVWVKDNFAKGPMSKLVTGSRGYFTSIAFKTVPYYFTHSTESHCIIRNASEAPAYKLDEKGMPVGEPFARGEVMFDGPLMVVSAGTVPFYGFEFKMHPFAAKRDGYMHLRTGNLATAAILANLPKLWKGDWFPTGIVDFHAREVEVTFDKPMPLQIAGDGAGYQSQLKFGVSKTSIELIDFVGSTH